MNFIDYKTYTGKENMQIDFELLEKAIQSHSKEPVFRLYDFLIGNIDSVRRLTGGRALLHDDEVTYSYISPISIIPNGESVTLSYRYISSILIDFFKTLGINLDFGENKKVSTHFNYCMLLSTGADVCYKGKKIIGSAQFRKNGYLLQHGSILFGYDKKLLESLFNEEVKGITTVKEILPDITKEEFIFKLKKYLQENFNN